jgi:single-stranded DNA-binding protein
MAINNTIELTGNMSKKGVRIIETEESKFAVLSLATTDSYKDSESDEWKNKETEWHDLIAFNPSVIEILKGLNTKARIKIIGTLSYRTFPVEIDVEENGEQTTKVINKKEASIIVRKVEQAPLVKKS